MWQPESFGSDVMGWFYHHGFYMHILALSPPLTLDGKWYWFICIWAGKSKVQSRYQEWGGDTLSRSCFNNTCWISHLVMLGADIQPWALTMFIISCRCRLLWFQDYILFIMFDKCAPVCQNVLVNVRQCVCAWVCVCVSVCVCVEPQRLSCLQAARTHTVIIKPWSHFL